MDRMPRIQFIPHFTPHQPASVDDTGLSADFLSDLALKIMYRRALLTGNELADALKLPFPDIVEHVVEGLRREHLIEVRGVKSGGFGEAAFHFAITERGRVRARELADDNAYAGPAPVPLETYREAVADQSLTRYPISQANVRQALHHLVLSEKVVAQIGPAVNSCKSIMFFGNTGNGKTAIANAIGAMLPGPIYIPYAICTDNHIIKLYDLLNHHPIVEGNDSVSNSSVRYDQRWVLIKRPSIATGGELTLDALDLVHDPSNKYYEAPYQMKANGGVFLIDDFGRQLVRPHDLLNRWILPLERRMDFLTLVTGRKLEVPFDALIVFSTNLNPADLVDEAFLRRIRYKIHVPDPTWEQYREILIGVCRERDIPYDEQALAYLKGEYELDSTRKPRGVHPRDIIDELADIARYQGVPPVLSPQLLEEACSSYFLKE
jgi:predicted ATPase with chaperone activity